MNNEYIGIDILWKLKWKQRTIGLLNVAYVKLTVKRVLLELQNKWKPATPKTAYFESDLAELSFTSNWTVDFAIIWSTATIPQEHKFCKQPQQPDFGFDISGFLAAIKSSSTDNPDIRISDMQTLIRAHTQSLQVIATRNQKYGEMK